MITTKSSTFSLATFYSLANLGWRPIFQQQLELSELDQLIPARVMEHHRTKLELAGEHGTFDLQITPSMPNLTVGDWLLIDEEQRFQRALDRFSCFSRKAPGSDVSEQLIAANVDSAFIVSSLNDDFNLSRIERFLSMVNESSAEPVVVLTKKDRREDFEDLVAQVQALDNLLSVISVNALDQSAREELLPWCSEGRTIVLLGSSGAGKSTLTNTLLQAQIQSTAGIREADSKGRHTTTTRSLLPMDQGALILDTPGMRELQLLASEAGIAATFADIQALADQCRFSDCSHDSEPDCAVQAAMHSGSIDERRLHNYRKLLREQANNSASLAQKRAQDKELGKFYKRVIGESVKHKRGE